MKKPKVTFWLKRNGEKDKNKPALIMYNFRYGERFRLSTGLTISLKNWEEKNSFPKTSFADYSEYKKVLRGIEDKVHECYDHYTALGSIPKPESIKQFIQGHNQLIPETEIKDFFEWHNEFVEERNLKLDPKTVKKDVTLAKLLKQFEQEKKYPILFKTIDLSFETRFKHYLNNKHEQNNTTVGKYIDCIKVFMKWAQKKGYHHNTEYQDFKSDKEPTKVIALSEAEVDRLEQLDLSKQLHLERVRDKFIFQLKTAQRFEDVRTLTWSNIKFDESGEIYWNLFQTKGSQTQENQIILLGSAREKLLKQKKGELHEFVFPDMKNQPFNRAIKTVCKLAKIEEHTVKVFNRGNKRVEESGPKYKFISSHTARRSYCTIASEKGMPENAIKGVTGHKSSRMLNRYIAKSQKYIDAEAKKYWAA